MSGKKTWMSRLTSEKYYTICEMSNDRMKEPHGFTKVAVPLYNLRKDTRNLLMTLDFVLCDPRTLSQETGFDV